MIWHGYRCDKYMDPYMNDLPDAHWALPSGATLDWETELYLLHKRRQDAINNQAPPPGFWTYRDPAQLVKVEFRHLSFQQPPKDDNVIRTMEQVCASLYPAALEFSNLVKCGSVFGKVNLHPRSMNVTCIDSFMPGPISHNCLFILYNHSFLSN